MLKNMTAKLKKLTDIVSADKSESKTVNSLQSAMLKHSKTLTKPKLKIKFIKSPTNSTSQWDKTLRNSET